jgi:N-acetylmuramoyl-L-alanine amidase
MLPAPVRRSLPWLLVVTGCAPAKPSPVSPAAPRAEEAAPSAPLPPVPEVRGPLALRVIYPARGAAISVRDSSFLFGSAGTGAARLTINGQPVQVWPNGAWLAWMPFPTDSIMRFRLEASTGTDSARLDHEVRRLGRGGDSPLLSVSPQGRVWWPADEYLPILAYAPEGSWVQVRLPGGVVVPLTRQTDLDPVPAAVRAFELDSQKLTTTVRVHRYVGVVRGRAIGPHPGPLLGADSAASAVSPRVPSRADTLGPIVEAIRGSDTLRAPWPIRLALLDTLPQAVSFDDDTARRGDTDSTTVGRATPGGTYHWFFPTGTRAAVTGRVNQDLRVRLGPAASTAIAWVAAAEAYPLPSGTSAATAVAGSLTLRPSVDRVSLRIPVSYRTPFQVTEGERSLVVRLYGVVGDIDWIRHGAEAANSPADPLIRRIRWEQAGPDVVVTVDLSAPVWGYRARWQRNDLVLEIRRPPAIDASEPLRGRVVVVDPGHPPAGAVGPTGLREAEANLAVALRLRALLEAAGARVLMTRTADTAVDLWPRVRFAEAANADVLVSIHNNALPDGINPFTNNGTGVFYNQPRSVPLAREIQRALLRRLGLRDLGIARGDLALVRTTWMPSVLCEGLFLILPEQEAALRLPEGQERYAQGVFEGVRRFFRQSAEERER